MLNVPMMDFEGLHISRELGEQVIQLIQKNDNLEAIRVLREGAGVDLKTAKDAVDAYCEKNQQVSYEKKGNKTSKRHMIIFIVILLFLGLIFKEVIADIIMKEIINTTFEKPIIYLYPEEEMDVTVKVDLEGDFICTYPEYNDGWEVVAKPDGTLIEKNTGLEYSYLFWEGTSNVEYDMTEGFVVAGEDTAEFLQSVLVEMGLTPKEYNEFIVYWMPQMKDNPYNLITFQKDSYTEYAKLDINPTPDTVLRVFMAYKPLQEPIEIEVPEIVPFERNGFTVVEWGGCRVN